MLPPLSIPFLSVFRSAASRSPLTGHSTVICKIVDYGKFKYDQLRKEKEARKKQRTVEIKEIRLSHRQIDGTSV